MLLDFLSSSASGRGHFAHNSHILWRLGCIACSLWLFIRMRSSGVISSRQIGILIRFYMIYRRESSFLPHSVIYYNLNSNRNQRRRKRIWKILHSRCFITRPKPPFALMISAISLKSDLLTSVCHFAKMWRGACDLSQIPDDDDD